MRLFFLSNLLLPLLPTGLKALDPLFVRYHMDGGHMGRERAGIGQTLDGCAIQSVDWHNEAMVNILRMDWEVNRSRPLKMQVVAANAQEKEHHDWNEHDHYPGAIQK